VGVVRESANGRIAYTVPSSHLGLVFRDVVLELPGAQIVEVQANDRSDGGDPRYRSGSTVHRGVRIDVKAFLRRHIMDTLIDEKMAGSFHSTPGGADAQGNPSRVHWDIVQSRLPNYGGG
jgi:aminopeptidase